MPIYGRRILIKGHFSQEGYLNLLFISHKLPKFFKSLKKKKKHYYSYNHDVVNIIQLVNLNF